jgi:branched-chain amino acid transport system ATP-binding protein
MSAALIELSGVSKRFGGFVALDGVELKIAPAERIGLIGPNGSGKSTLVNCIGGVLRNEEGVIRFEGRDITAMAPHRRLRLGVARSFQLPKPFTSMTVRDNLSVPLMFGAAARPRPSPTEWIDEAMALLREVGLEQRAGAMSGTLTQVDMRKLELARAMAAKPKLLIADEALAGLSDSEVDDILELLLGLKAKGVAVVMIEHIMRAVMRFSERLVVLVAGRKIADGEPKAVIANPDVVKAYLGE